MWRFLSLPIVMFVTLQHWIKKKKKKKRSLRVWQIHSWNQATWQKADWAPYLGEGKFTRKLITVGDGVGWGMQENMRTDDRRVALPSFTTNVNDYQRYREMFQLTSQVWSTSTGTSIKNVPSVQVLGPSPSFPWIPPLPVFFSCPVDVENKILTWRSIQLTRCQNHARKQRLDLVFWSRWFRTGHGCFWASPAPPRGPAGRPCTRRSTGRCSRRSARVPKRQKSPSTSMGRRCPPAKAVSQPRPGSRPQPGRRSCICWAPWADWDERTSTELIWTPAALLSRLLSNCGAERLVREEVHLHSCAGPTCWTASWCLSAFGLHDNR